MYIGGDIRITAVEPYKGLQFLIDELFNLNAKYQLVENSQLEAFAVFSVKDNNSFYHNDIVVFHMLKDNYDALFLASDLFENINIPDKQNKIQKAESVDERMFLKIRAKNESGLRLGLLLSAAFCNLTDGIIDLIAYSDERYTFNHQCYSKNEWEVLVVNCFATSPSDSDF